MKHAILIAALVLLVTAVIAPSAGARRAPCSQAMSVRALPQPLAANGESDGLQLYVMIRCGRQVGIPFG